MKQALISLIVLVLAGTLIFFVLQRKDGVDETAVCTQEALLCPDGSGVGREGSVCAFRACPNQSSFEGVLEQTPDGFRLVMASPEEIPGSATYVMPLHIKVSNVLADIVGKRVNVVGTFSEGNTLEVTQLEERAGTESDATRGVLKVGETKLINGVKVTLNAVSNDSRCPIDAQCVWAGSITAKVTLLSDTDTETVDITSGTEPHGFDSFLVSVEGADPAPLGGVDIPPEEYGIHMLVEHTTL